MKTTDTSEKSLESIIVASLVKEAGYVQGDPQDYDREHAVDLARLLQFLAATQPDTYGRDQAQRKGFRLTICFKPQTVCRRVIVAFGNGHFPLAWKLVNPCPRPFWRGQ